MAFAFSSRLATVWVVASRLHLAVSQQTCVNSIAGFTLIDTDLEVEIRPLVDGDVLDYAKLPTQNLNVRADYSSCADTPVDSVYTSYKTSLNISDMHCERYTPYSVFRDNNPGGPDLGPMGPFDPFTLPLAANQTIEAVPYTGPKCQGTKGNAAAVTFDVVNTSPCPGKVLNFALWDADSQTPEMALIGGSKFCPKTKDYNIQARVVDCQTGTVGSVKLALMKDGSMVASAVEKRDMYFLKGDYQGTINGGGILADGVYQMTATPFSAKGANGKSGPALTIDFEVSCGCENAVTGFTLVDGDLDQEIGPLPAVIDYASLPTLNLNVRPIYNSCTTGTVQSVYAAYSIDNNVVKRSCAQSSPYNIFPGPKSSTKASLRGSLDNGTFPVGANQSIEADPYDGVACNGDMGQGRIGSFDVVNTALCPGAISSFVMWDADSQTPIRQIKQGDVFCPNITSYNIEARTVSCQEGKVGSVKFEMSGAHSWQHVDRCDQKKFFMYRDSVLIGTKLTNGRSLSDGSYSLKATPWSRRVTNGFLGDQGRDLQIDFTIDCGLR